MKKTVLMFATAALAALSLSAVAGNTVSAADKTSTQTDATVKLTADNTVGDKSGKIQLVKAPNLTFAEKAINASGDTKTNATGVDPLTVLNPGVAAAWAVNVNAGQFTNDADSSIVLAGATIALTGDKDASDNAKNPAAFDGKTIDTAGTNAEIFASAKSGSLYTGVGNNAEKISAEMTVPAGNVAGSYTSKLTWTLSATPSDNVSDGTPAATTTDGE